MGCLGRTVGLEGISETMIGEVSQLHQVATVRGIPHGHDEFDSQITLYAHY
jgi:hypothetical protein